MKKSYTIAETAKICETTIWTIYKRLKEQSLKGYRVAGGRGIRILHEELILFFKTNNIPLPPELTTPVRKKILIVDDDTKILETLSNYFQESDQFEFSTVSNGFQAGILIKSFLPDMVILDIMLGDIDGREFIKVIRSDSQLQSLKVLGISGYLSQDEMQELLNAGFDDFLPKPFRIHQMHKMIEKLLNIS